MTPTSRIDVARLIRTATLLVGLACASAVYATFQPQIDFLQQRIDENNSQLRSDEVAQSTAGTLRRERSDLATRYATLVAQNPQAVFVRELAALVRRHAVALVSTTVAAAAPNDAPEPGALFSKTRLSIVMSGPYRRLLAAVSDLSNGSEIVEVLPPSLARDGADVVATIPLDIYEPLRSTPGTNRMENVR